MTTNSGLAQVGLGSHIFQLDVVGIGALNLDYVASSATVPLKTDEDPLMRRLADLVTNATGSFTEGAEHSVDEKTIYAALEEIATVSMDINLGGSAFNAIFALSQMQLGLRLGFVGVAGRVPAPGLSSVTQFDNLGIDRTFVLNDELQTCGICVSYTDSGERTLLTFSGANDQAAALIESRFDSLVSYLASTNVIHVTSFLDTDTAERLLALLTAVKATSRHTVICFDPGHEWSVQPSAAIEGLVRLSDFLLLNHSEFKSLGHYTPGTSDEDVARSLFTRFDNCGAVVIVKRTEGILSFRQVNGAIVNEHFAQVPLPRGEIRDATGAGDVFAAGLIAVLAANRLKSELGCSLGMRLARHKLGYVGVRGHVELARLAGEFLHSREAERRRTSLAPGVFIAHGGDPQWHRLKHFVEQDCELSVYAFESDSWESHTVIEALGEYLNRSSFAVCVMTAEDTTRGGLKRARQNVIHEAGLFQGRYGFDRVMLLIEDGCDLPGAMGPNILTFPHNAIDKTFWQLHRMLRRHGSVRFDQALFK